MIAHHGKWISIILSGWLFCIFEPVSAGTSQITEKEWRFRVFLDDREIGYHYFSLKHNSKSERLTTRARFDVTFLKIPVFRYRHRNTENWSDQCLKSINSTTRENNKQYRVNGAVTGNGFTLTSTTGTRNLPPCISTFAYWDKSFLKHSRLLNSQTGDFLDVEVDYLGEKPAPSGHSDDFAHHYKLSTDNLEIELWYSQKDDEWLGLKSTTRNGRLLRYVME